MRKQKEFLIDVSDYSGAQVVDNDAFFTRDTDAYLIFRPTNMYINYDSALLYLTNIANGATLLDLPTTKVDDSYLEFKLTPDILEAYGAWKGQILFQLNGSTAASSSFEFTVNRFLTDSRPANPVEIVTIDQIRSNARRVIEDITDAHETIEQEEIGRAHAEAVRVENETIRENNYDRLLRTVIAVLAGNVFMGVQWDKRSDPTLKRIEMSNLLMEEAINGMG